MLGHQDTDLVGDFQSLIASLVDRRQLIVTQERVRWASARAGKS